MIKKVDLAIITPTLNEERYIGKLLDSIVSQTVLPKEIVIVDAESKDKTIEEIKKRQKKLLQLRYYQIPKYSISRQRNFGVNKTKSKNILFLDADMQFKNFEDLEKYIDEVSIRKLEMAVSDNLPLSSYWKDKVFFKMKNLLFRISLNFWPMIVGENIFIKRSLFNKLKGFDEEIKIGEDMELLQRALKFKMNYSAVNCGESLWASSSVSHSSSQLAARHSGSRIKFGFLNSVSVYTSVRRLQKNGRRKFILKLLRNFFITQFKGYKRIPNDYEYGNFR